MTKIQSIGRWCLIAACAAEGIFFCFIWYIFFQIDRAFQSSWLDYSWSMYLIFLGVGLTGFYSAFVVFRRRPWARYLSGCLLLGTAANTFAEVFMNQPYEWIKLVWCVPPVLGLCCLLSVWTRSEFWLVRQPS